MFRLEQLVKEQKSKVSKVMPAEKDSAAKQMILWILSLEFYLQDVGSSDKHMITQSWSLEFHHLFCLWHLILMYPLVNVKVLLDGLYDRGCSLNLMKRDKDGIARDYSPILENIWEFTTKWPNWEVLNKACVILMIANFIINVGLAGQDASTDITDTS